MNRDVYADVTETIITMLEGGSAPWRKPWSATTGAPRNLKGKAYRGINVFILLSAGYGSPTWMTFNAAKAAGGMVRKGEKGTRIILWKPTTRTVDDVAKRGMFLTTFTVFNAQQVDGLTLPEAGPVLTIDPIEAAEAIVAGMPNRPTIAEDGGGRAFYRPSEDGIHMPRRDSFATNEEWYSTLFHELTHSTGHASRVGRDGVVEITHFGSDQYGREELVAEMGNAFLSGEAGIGAATAANSAAYLRGWIAAIKEDTKMVVWAAGKAQVAADYILDRTKPQEA